MRCGGNLRNGSNAGLSYLNCRNRLRNANWNYLSANFVNYNHTINAASYFGCQRVPVNIIVYAVADCNFRQLRKMVWKRSRG